MKLSFDWWSRIVFADKVALISLFVGIGSLVVGVVALPAVSNLFAQRAGANPVSVASAEPDLRSPQPTQSLTEPRVQNPPPIAPIDPGFTCHAIVTWADRQVCTVRSVANRNKTMQILFDKLTGALKYRDARKLAYDQKRWAARMSDCEHYGSDCLERYIYARTDLLKKRYQSVLSIEAAR